MNTLSTTSPITTLTLDTWRADASSTSLQKDLEQGQVLFCPHLPFALEADEQRFLDPIYSDDKRKSIYIRAGQEGVLGTQASAEDQAALLRMIKRYESHSMALLATLFPGYVGAMKAMGTSLRPRAIGSGDAALSWRKDDTRLHIDAFPSNPTQGVRILRVFSNIGTTPREWRVGEPFENMARHFLPRLQRRTTALPGSAWLLHRLGITKRLRTPYDHLMLHLHDAAKADLQYQKDCPQTPFDFPAGSTWICYSDQVMHAAMAGQFMMEQTIHVPMRALAYPDDSPLRVLERLTGKPLLAGLD